MITHYHEIWFDVLYQILEEFFFYLCHLRQIILKSDEILNWYYELAAKCSAYYKIAFCYPYLKTLVATVDTFDYIYVCF